MIVQRYTFECLKNGAVTKRKWVHGSWVAHTDCAALQTVLRECVDALEKSRSMLEGYDADDPNPDYAKSMQKIDAAITAAEKILSP